MPNFHVTQEKINALVEELRSWDAREERYTLQDLARMFHLDIFVVDRIARTEGVRVSSEKAMLEEERRMADFGSDPNASTLDLDPDEIQEALSKPDPNPDYKDRDEDTGVWRKKPTGEWERIPPGYTREEDED